MDVRRLSDPAEFLAAAMPLLMADEARHNLVLGLAGVLRDRPGYYEEFRLWLVESSGAVVGAATQTPPFALVLAQPNAPDALPALAENIAEEGLDLPGVVAATPEADAFADAWESRRDVRRELERAQRIYRLTEVRRPGGVSGAARVATADDTALLVEWLHAFLEEISTEAPSPATDAERIVAGRLEDPNAGFLLWEDGREPVSTAGWGSPTPNGIRVGPVYTPPERRSRGYGSAVTAALSADQLAAGRRFCFLYTDLANPTSNKIYAAIGYEPFADFVKYAFD